MTRVKGYKNVTTQGTYMGEEGTGYAFGELKTYGDFSQATRGHLQGYTEPCEFEVLMAGARVLETQGGEWCLFPASGTAFVTEYGPLPVDHGLAADMSLAYGFVRVVED